MFGAEQTRAGQASKLDVPPLQEFALTASLTPQQITILRRVAEGLGLPAYVLRPRNCAQDVEVLRLLGFIAADAGALSIASAGSDYLAMLDSGGSLPRLANLRVVHGRDQSISVEHWPQEY